MKNEYTKLQHMANCPLVLAFLVEIKAHTDKYGLDKKIRIYQEKLSIILIFGQQKQRSTQINL